jgi:hypothetical protein
MATIVNTTEEEPTLAVVRFTAELAWADAGPEVVEAEVGRLCLEAQEHIFAALWAEMASLMLASADLLLNSSRVPDKGIPRFLPSKRLPVLELSPPPCSFRSRVHPVRHLQPRHQGRIRGRGDADRQEHLPEAQPQARRQAGAAP